MNDKKMLVAYAIQERNGKTFWNRIGVAFVNRDGSINVKLELFPVGGGDIQLREYVAQEGKREGGDWT